MNADSCFYIGKTHKVCEDYALHSNQPSTPETGLFAILCDGCSSSPDTDFGARLLARAAAVNLTRTGIHLTKTIQEAYGWASSIRLSSYALDATLLAVRESGPGEVIASVVGDGVVAARRRDGVIDWFQIEFPSGAPSYLNYFMDLERLRTYARETEDCLRVLRIFQDEELLDEQEIRTPLVTDGLRPLGVQHPGFLWEQGFSAEHYDIVAVISDGATSFQRRAGLGMESIPPWEVVKRVLAVKGTKGEFLSRRVNRFLKAAYTDGWQHVDDLAVAAIYLSPSEED